MKMRWSKIWGIWLIALMLIITAGCGTADKANTNQNSQPAQQEQGSTATTDEGTELKTEYPLTVTDAKGQEYTFESAPKKIVSLAPSETEILFAIGLDQEIVGVSDYDDYPEAATTKPKMGGFQVNVEGVVAAEPDVIFTANLLDPVTVNSLKDLGLKVFQTDAKNVDDVINIVQQYGLITDHQGEAKQVTDKMNEELAMVTDAVKSLTDDQKKRVYLEFSPGWTVGKGEFIDDVLNLAGGINVASDTTGWSEINEENIIKSNPQVILYSNIAVDENNNTLAEIIKGRSGWDQITAIKEERVIGLDDNLVSRPGPRVTQGLIEVAKAIYPELFQP